MKNNKKEMIKNIKLFNRSDLGGLDLFLAKDFGLLSLVLAKTGVASALTKELSIKPNSLRCKTKLCITLEKYWLGVSLIELSKV